MTPALSVWTTLLDNEKTTVQPHPDLDTAKRFVESVVKAETGPMTIQIWRLRYFREETKPSQELVSVYRR